MDNIQLFKGDCLEVMKKIPDKSVDMILCDLPFELTDNEWDKIIDFEKMWYQYNRIIKDNGAIVLFGVEPFSSKIRMSNLKFYKYDWYWEKARPTGFLNARKQPLRNIETISVFYKKQCTYNPQGVISCKKMTKRSKTGDNWITTTKNEYVQTQTNYPKQIIKFNHDKNKLHPTQKPVALLEYLIKTYTNENEIVLDNCMGSGSTGVACLNTNRKFIGIELNDEYFTLAKNRIENISKNGQK
jgi:site-specific DNA-methyltransferase (adenine-specific)